jgi:hypothetical protein
VGRKYGIATSYIERLSARRDWVKRAAAFDDEQDRLAQAQLSRRIQAMNDRHAKIAATALEKVASRLESLDPDSLRPSDLARLLEVAARGERVAMGGSTM